MTSRDLRVTVSDEQPSRFSSSHKPRPSLHEHAWDYMHGRGSCNRCDAEDTEVEIPTNSRNTLGCGGTRQVAHHRVQVVTMVEGIMIQEHTKCKMSYA